MVTRSALRLLAVITIAAATIGTDTPAAAAIPLPEPLPDRPLPTTALPTPDAISSAIETEVVRVDAAQLAADLAAWYAAEQANRDRLAAELNQLWAWRILTVDDLIAQRTGRYLPWSTVALVIEAADRHGVDAVLLGRIGACESGGRADAYNPSGASGFGQHLAAYWPGRATAAGWPGASPFDLAANIDVTAWYLSQAGTSPWNPSRYCWN